MKRYIILVLSILSFNQLNAQNSPSIPSTDKKMEWFAQAKLGIFIHWGIYAVNGISESWSFFNNYINHDAYLKQLDGFNASQYKPNEWVNLIAASGAKYAVITTKHHDGISLWDTKAENAITTLKNSASKKDLITPFISELKKSGLKTGLYYSLPDWSYNDYDIFTRDRKRYDFKAEPNRWLKFTNYYQSQLKELSNSYKPDLVWFDGDWEHKAEEWQTDKVRNILQSRNPNIIINARLDEHGDYETPEQGIPVLRPSSKYWELCYTMNDSWGYQPYDTHYKSSNMIIRTLVDCISMGGNLLLDIGPKADGTIPAEQVKILKDLGRWTHKHAEAIYETETGIPAWHFNGKTALSKDKKSLFLYVDYNDTSGYILSGLQSRIKDISVVGSTEKILAKPVESDDYLIKVPANAFDQDVTVIRINFNEAVKLNNQEDLRIAYNAIFAKESEKHATLKIKKLVNTLSKSTNIFNGSNLANDGLGFKANVTPLDEETNNWVIKNAEVLYKTTKGIPEGHYQGNTALSADRQTLYLFVEGIPTGPIAIKGLKNSISRIRIVGEGTMLPHEIYNKLYWSKIPGIVYIPIPKEKLDKHLTVIAVLLDSPIELYREKVGAIESN